MHIHRTTLTVTLMFETDEAPVFLVPFSTRRFQYRELTLTLCSTENVVTLVAVTSGVTLRRDGQAGQQRVVARGDVLGVMPAETRTRVMEELRPLVRAQGWDMDSFEQFATPETR